MNDETILIWLDNLLERNGLNSKEELTIAQIEEEISEVQGERSNNRAFLLGSDDSDDIEMFEQNDELYEEYLSILEEMKGEPK